MSFSKALRALLGAAALLVVSNTAARALDVDVNVFFDDLSPHGRWIESRDYGNVWVPRVASSWRPYTLGHWVWTDDYGWMWVSDESFGWATYHYGRWYQDPSYGWAWVPGYDWSPAWVSYREGGGYVGWAPLSPRVPWSGGASFRVGSIQLDAFIEPRAYNFVPERHFLDRNPYRYGAPVTRNTNIINVTQNITNYNYENNRIVNRGIAVDRVEKVSGRRVPHMRVAEVNEAAAGPQARRRAVVQGNEVRVFKPTVRKAEGGRFPAPSARPNAKAGDVRAQQRTQQQQQAQERRDAQQREQGRRSQENADRQKEVRDRNADQRRQAQETQAQRQRQQQDDKRQQQERLQAQRQREQAARTGTARQTPQQQQEARKKEQAQRQQETAQRQQQQRDRNAEQQRQSRQAQEAQRNRQQIEKRQAQERNTMERTHGRDIKNSGPGVSAQAQEERRQAEHRELQDRQRKERQALDGNREQPKRAQQEAPRAQPRPEQPRPQAEARKQPQQKQQQKQAQPKQRGKNDKTDKKGGGDGGSRQER